MSSSYNDPVEVLKEWVARVNARDLEGVLSLYSEDAVLLPTFSPEIRSSRDRIQAYFEGLSGYEDVVVDLHEASVTVHSLSDHCHCIGGTYGWSWKADGVATEVEARFTYTVDLRLAGPIVHHHSSEVPG
jgi:hypothetical protein